LRRVALFLALTIVAVGPAPRSGAQGQPSSLRVLSREGLRTLATVTQNNQEHVALDELAQVFGLTVREDQLAGGLTITSGTRSIIVTPDQPVVSVAGRLVSLTGAPVRQGNRWLFPIDFLSRAVGPLLETRFDLRRATRLLVIGDLRVPRVVAHVDPSPAAVSVTFDITPPAPSRVMVESGRLVVSFEADALELTLPPVPAQDFLQALQPGETPTSVRITTGAKFALHRATTSQPDPGASRLVIELLPATTETAAPPTAPVPATPATPGGDVPPPPVSEGVRTIVIDAGHGGDETGAKGAKGTLEKDVTLAVARRLRTMIEGRLGLRVFLTRDDDRLVTLDERSAYANSQKADVFVSLHANASVRPAMKGAEVYSLAPDRADTEARLQAESAGEILPALGGGSRAIDLIPWETAQARYLEQSTALAAIVEQALRTRVPMSPRAIQQAPFRVLVGANMPAVLVEIGYLSSAEQEPTLSSGAFQDQVAQSLFDALAEFRARSERPAAPAAPGTPSAPGAPVVLRPEP
jgi:N-acetylmuramoyl-L-alanine amidase